MKFFGIIAIVCGIVLLMAESTFCQIPQTKFRKAEQPAGFKELYELKTKARKTLDSRPRRVESRIEDYSKDSGYELDESIYEFLAEDRNRYLKKTIYGKEHSEEETIYLGNYIYIRQNGSPWAKLDLGNALEHRMTGDFDTATEKCSVKELSVQSTFAGNLPARLFTETAFTNGKLGIIKTINQTWIGFDGSILREFTEKRYLTEGRLENESNAVLYRSTAKYEYDPIIKIEAPIP